jgi:hypothetical protein
MQATDESVFTTAEERENAAYERAKKRVEELKEYYSHLAIYLIVNGVLFAVDYLSGEGWWFYWPALFWGIGLAIHTFTTFVSDGPFGHNWEERKIRELMDRGS